MVTTHTRDPRSLWIVVPAYNEAKAIRPVVSSLRAQGYPVVVIDDGSADDTAGAALETGAIVLRHLLNLGQGGALQTGLTFCLESGARYICTFDADGQHRAEDIAPMWERLVTGGFDIVLGSRFLGDARGISLSRTLLLKAAVLFTRMHSGLKLTDAHNGLRVMTAEAAARLKLKQMGMAHASEIVDQIAKLQLKYCEAPVSVIYTDYSKAKGQSALESIRILMDLIVGRTLR
jgi:glycosyltransferase involved in cell wall biosynthesis